jgi:hypothetical protein
MATGDFTVFEEAKAYMIDSGWEAADDIKVALVTNAVNPTAGDTTPALADYTQVTPGGNYTAGGISIGTLSACVSEAAGTMTFDSATNPSWAVHASNPTNAYWGIVYNDTDAGDAAIGFVELGGPINMSAAALTITWHSSGLYTIV